MIANQVASSKTPYWPATGPSLTSSCIIGVRSSPRYLSKNIFDASYKVGAGYNAVPLMKRTNGVVSGFPKSSFNFVIVVAVRGDDNCLSLPPRQAIGSNPDQFRIPKLCQRLPVPGIPPSP